jgi:hypothetical protein
MDFDDMEDSYFAFLANTKKIVTDGRFNTLMPGSNANGESPKIRSRGGGGSNPGTGPGSKPGGNPPNIGSLPSIPSLPTRGGGVTPTGSGPNFASTADSSRNVSPIAQNEARPSPATTAPQGGMSMSWILVGVLLVAALGIFGFVIFGK